MTIPEDATVWFTVRGDRFHTSKDCAGKPGRQHVCSLKEAVYAGMTPCGNCCGDRILTAYSQVRGP